MIFVSTALAHPAFSCLKLLALLFLAFWAITQMQARVAPLLCDMPLLTLSWAVQASAAQDRPMLTPHFPREHEFGATGITKPAFCSPPKTKKKRSKTWDSRHLFTLSSAHN
jgi:hypothetical protein